MVPAIPHPWTAELRLLKEKVEHQDHRNKYAIKLESGSLIIMKADLQHSASYVLDTPVKIMSLFAKIDLAEHTYSP